MARTKTITDKQILEAAREMFHEHGFSVTTAQIAEAAGVSEGSIFRRWSSKDELMVAAMGIERPSWLEKLRDRRDSDLPVREELTEIAGEILEFFLEHLPKMTAMLSCGAQMREMFVESPDVLPVRGIRGITGYFEHLRRRGRIRNVDPEIAGRMFVASVFHYAFAEITGLNEHFPMPRETYIRGIVDNILRGIETPPEQ